MTPQDRARRSAEAMWANDTASQRMGMKIEEIAPGRAVLSMQVQPHHPVSSGDRISDIR